MIVYHSKKATKRYFNSYRNIEEAECLQIIKLLDETLWFTVFVSYIPPLSKHVWDNLTLWPFF